MPTFQIMQDAQQVGTGVVNDDGTFTLKAGQSAVFDGLMEVTDGYFVVRETMPDNISDQYLGADYDVISEGGTTTEETKEETVEGQFTQYTTDTLDAANRTTTVLYKNRVDMDALSLLNVTKVIRPGSEIAEGTEFQIRIQIDNQNLAVGTPYTITRADGTVGSGTIAEADNGIIRIRENDVISLPAVILQGSVISVSEVNDGGYTITYSGTIAGGETVNMTVAGNRISGTVVDTNSTANVTVYNADYSFAARLPIAKTLAGANATDVKAFSFNIQELNNDLTETDDKPYSMTLTTSGSATRTDTIYFGFADTTEAGVYKYRVTEVIPTDKGGISYDESSYIVEITVSDNNGMKSAAVTKVTKCTSHTATSGTVLENPASSTLAFVNSKSGALSLTKIAKKDGEDLSGTFTFRINIPTANGTYFVYDAGNKQIGTVTFTNGNISGATEELEGTDATTIIVKAGQTIVIKGLPAGQTATITETNTDGFAVSWEGDGLANAASANGPSTQTKVINGAATVAVTCINTTGAALPNTGGIGTSIYTLLGSMMMLSAGVLLMIHRRRREAT